MEVQVSKKNFIKAIEYVLKYKDLEDKLYEMGIEISEPSELVYKLFDIIMDSLCEDSKDVVNWWIWESGKTLYVDDKEIELNNAEDLWNCIKFIENANRSI